MHVLPPRMHGLKGYYEIIESIRWGLESLGHQVTYGANSYDESATNIIFGAQIIPIEDLQQLKSDTIIYNLEQIKGLTKDRVRPEMQFFAKAFTIWDYSEANLPVWNNLGCKEVKIVPIGYAPILTRIEKPQEQDIDVLLYGLPGDKRLIAFNNLAVSDFITVFACGLYGQARDHLISRSKLILNVNRLDISRIFEIARVSYLLANKKAVISLVDPDTHIEEDIKSHLKFTNTNDFLKDCRYLIENDLERKKYEQSGFDIFSKRDIREVLANALT